MSDTPISPETAAIVHNLITKVELDQRAKIVESMEKRRDLRVASHQIVIDHAKALREAER